MKTSFSNSYHKHQVPLSENLPNCDFCLSPHLRESGIHPPTMMMELCCGVHVGSAASVGFANNNLGQADLIYAGSSQGSIR